MTDSIGSFGFAINTSQLTSATQALSDFDRQGQSVGASVADLVMHMDAMVQSMQRMIDMQQQTNDLLRRGADAQRDAARSIDDTITSFTHWQIASTAASYAWDLFGDKSRDAAATTATSAATMQQNFQRVADTIDGLNAKIAAIDTMKLSYAVGNVFGSTPYGALANTVVDPFGSAGINQRLDQLAQQVDLALNQAVARTNISGPTLLSGTAAGERLGMNEQESQRALLQVQQALQGVSLEAVRARQAMVLLGADTSNAAVGLTGVIDRLSQIPAGPERNAILQQILPGADPAMLMRSNVLGSRPQGGSERYFAAEAERVSAVDAERARSREEQAKLDNDPNARTMFGFLPASGGRTFGRPREFPFYSEYFDPNSTYSHVYDDLSQQQSLAFTKLMRRQGPLLPALGEYASTSLGTIGQEFMNLGRPLPFVGDMIPDYQPQAPAGETDDQRQQRQLAARISNHPEVEQFLMRAGRQSPQMAKLRLDQETAQGQVLVNSGALDQDEFNAAVRLLTARYQRAVAPFDELIKNLDEQNSILAMPPEQQAEARMREQIRRGRRQHGNEDNGTPSPEEERAASAERTRVQIERQTTLNRLTNTAQSEADIAYAPVGDQPRLRAELQYRNQLYPQFAGAPPKLSSDEQAQFDANRAFTVDASGKRLMDQTDLQIQDTQKLAEAYTHGGEAAREAQAAQQAHSEALKGTISPAQEAARVAQLLSKSFEDLALQAEKALEAGRLHNEATSRLASAASGGPVSINRTAISNQVEEQYRAEIKAAGDDPVKLAEADRHRDEALRQRMTDAQSAEEQARRLRNYRFNQNMNGYGAVTGGNAQQQYSGGDLHDIARQKAREYGVPEEMFVHQIAGESGFRPNAHNDVGPGHYGLGQFDPATAARYGVDTHDPVSSLDGAARYMRDLAQRSGSWQGAMRSYLGARTDQGLQRVLSGNAEYASAYSLAGGSSGSGAQGLITRRLTVQAQQQLENEPGRISPVTAAETDEVARQNAATQAQQQLTSISERSKSTMQTLGLEQQRAAAAADSVRAEREMDDQIRVVEQTRRAADLAAISGNAQVIAGVQQTRSEMMQLAAVERGIADQRAQNTIDRQRRQQSSDVASEIAATAGGTQHDSEVQRQVNQLQAQQRSAGLSEYGSDEARQIADQMVRQKELSSQIATGQKQAADDMMRGVDAVVGGLEKAATGASKFKDVTKEIDQQMRQLAFDMIVKQPIEAMAKSVLGGQAFQFGGTALGHLLGSGGSAAGSGVAGAGFEAADQATTAAAGSSGFFGSLFSGIFRMGGMSDSPAVGRMLPAHLFWDAPRMRNGGLMPDEIPAVLHPGERVLTREQTQAYDGSSSGAGHRVEVHIHGVTDAPSFARARSQIYSDMSAVVSRAAGRR